MSGTMILNGVDMEGKRVSGTTIDGVPVEEWERRQNPRFNWTETAIAVLSVAGAVLLCLLG
ncbi:MAG: hypothetical protein IJT94_15185 [Oscillibacter sp.]|nr:hypothetical protein [Oscillibacter sp.]